MLIKNTEYKEFNIYTDYIDKKSNQFVTKEVTQQNTIWYENNTGVISLKERDDEYKRVKTIQIELMYINAYIDTTSKTIDSLSSYATILQIKIIRGDFHAAKSRFWESLDRFQKVSIVNPDGETLIKIKGNVENKVY